MDHVSLWIAGFLTLGILSFLYKDNPWYKLTEAIYVGISAGYWFVSLFWENFYGKFWVQRGEDPWLWIGAVLGFMMLLRLLPKIGWISRWPLAFLVGATGGLWLINYFASFVMKQIESTVSLYKEDTEMSLVGFGYVVAVQLLLAVIATLLIRFLHSFVEKVRINIILKGLMWLVLIGLVIGGWFGGFLLFPEAQEKIYAIVGFVVIALGSFVGLVYFFFSVEHKGVLGGTARVGIFFLMVTFGASFGYTVMSRMSLLIGRIDFILGDWLGVIG